MQLADFAIAACDTHADLSVCVAWASVRVAWRPKGVASSNIARCAERDHVARIDRWQNGLDDAIKYTLRCVRRRHARTRWLALNEEHLVALHVNAPHQHHKHYQKLLHCFPHKVGRPIAYLWSHLTT